MGISDWFGLGSAISKTADPIKAVGDLYTTDKARIEAQAKLEEVTQKPALAQIALNTVLANSDNIFKSAYVPLLGWTCGLLILLYYLPQIIVATWVWSDACFATGIVKPFPIKPDDLLNLVYLLITSKVYSAVTK
jgi:hypothetical protein